MKSIDDPWKDGAVFIENDRTLNKKDIVGLLVQFNNNVPERLARTRS